MPEITNSSDYIRLLSGDKINCSKEKISKLIYNDYTNLNISLIEEYDLDLSLFYEDIEIPNIKFDEIPLNKLQIIVDQMGIIIENRNIRNKINFISPLSLPPRFPTS